MSIREVLLFLIAMLYVAYPMYFLVCKPTRMRTRMFGLALIVYGAIGLFWPEINHPLLIIVCSLLVGLGFGVYLNVIKEGVPWMICITYGIAILFWPMSLDPLWIPVAMLLIIVAFDRMMTKASAQISGEYTNIDETDDTTH